MSDTSQGESWWEASDGKWYRPEQHPEYVDPRPLPPLPEEKSTESAVGEERQPETRPRLTDRQFHDGNPLHPDELRQLFLVVGITAGVAALAAFAPWVDLSEDTSGIGAGPGHLTLMAVGVASVMAFLGAVEKVLPAAATIAALACAAVGTADSIWIWADITSNGVWDGRCCSAEVAWGLMLGTVSGGFAAALRVVVIWQLATERSGNSRS